jgi:undecaprenyl-diphosphatase
MTAVEAIALGMIEGLTEFFPVSSTGHLLIAQQVFHIGEPDLFFNTVVQCGAIAAIIVYYRIELGNMIRELFSHQQKKRLIGLGIASIPVLTIGVLFQSIIERLHESIWVVIASTILVAIGMAIVDRMIRISKQKTEKPANTVDYMTVGLFQTLSLIPGVSRSGITVIGGLLRGWDFKRATDTAFLLGIPALGAAATYQTLKLLMRGNGIPTELVIPTLLGTSVAFITALSTIAITLPIFKKYGFLPFVIYRLMLGGLLILLVK